MKSGVLLLGCIVLVLLTGCDEDVPLAEGVDFPFTLYGVLDPAADTQMVRVFPVESSLAPGSPEPLDATVTSTDVQTGAVQVWRDSILTFENGTYGYLYWLPFRPEGGRTYRVDVTRSDGQTSSAVTTVPHLPKILPAEYGPFNEVLLPIILGPGDAQVRRLAIRQRVNYGWCGGEFVTFTFPLEEGVYSSGDVLRVDLPLDEAYRVMRKELTDLGRFQVHYGLLPFGAWMEVTVIDAGWLPPGGTFDPEVLIDPDAFRNVENGFGFLGSGYSAEAGVSIPRDEYVAAGFEPVEREGATCIGPPPPDITVDPDWMP